MASKVEFNCHLVNEGSPVVVGLQQDAGPQLRVLATNQITGQALEQRVLVAHLRHRAIQLSVGGEFLEQNPKCAS